MKFSLKTFLFGMCGVGAFVGILGKLLLEQPETFQSVLIALATIVPFVLAVGTVFYLGLRGERRWKLIAWGCFLILLPICVLLFQRLLMPTGNPLQLLTTRRLIERRLPQQIEEPWVWQELERRLISSRITAGDASDAVELLTLHMTTNRPAGWNQPLPWVRGFLSGAISGKLVSDAQLLKLCDAFFGPRPIVKPLAPAAGRQRGVQVELEYGNPWASTSGLGTDLLWEVKQVELDGKPMKISGPNRYANRWVGYCEGALTPGDHELKVDVECAYVDESSATGFGQGSNIPASQWPKAKKRWTTTVAAPVKIEAAESKDK